MCIVTKAGKVRTFGKHTDSGGEMIPRGNKNIEMNVMINCDKSYEETKCVMRREQHGWG